MIQKRDITLLKIYQLQLHCSSASVVNWLPQTIQKNCCKKCLLAVFVTHRICDFEESSFSRLIELFLTSNLVTWSTTSRKEESCSKEEAGWWCGRKNFPLSRRELPIRKNLFEKAQNSISNLISLKIIFGNTFPIQEIFDLRTSWLKIFSIQELLASVIFRFRRKTFKIIKIKKLLFQSLI